MEHWKTYKLSELCTKVTDGSHFSPSAQKSGYPMLSVKDMLEYGFDYERSKRISEEDFLTMRSNGCVPEKGDVLVAKDGSYLKQIFVCRESRDEAVLSSIAIFRPDRSKILPDYLCYLIKSPRVYDFISKNCVSGSALPRIVLKAFKEVKLDVPSLEIQNRVVAILKSIDDKINLNTNISRNLEGQSQALFKSWFVDYEPFTAGPFVDSELGLIPDGWRIGILNDYTSLISRGITPKYSTESDELILGQTCVRNNIVTLKNARTHTPKSKTVKWVRQWDALINSTGIGSLGRVGVVYFDLDNVTADSHITIVRSTNPIMGLYIGRALLNLQKEIENMAVGSTGQTELPTDSVKNIRLVIPPKDVLTRFYALIKPIGLQIFHLLEENKKLSALRDTLLPKLMSGEIAV